MKIRSRRRSLRRAIAVDCTVASDWWDGSLPLRASDLSKEGVWIDTPYPLEAGEEVVLGLAPPGAGSHEEVWAIAEVARVGMWRRCGFSPPRDRVAGAFFSLKGPPDFQAHGTTWRVGA